MEILYLTLTPFRVLGARELETTEFGLVHVVSLA